MKLSDVILELQAYAAQNGDATVFMFDMHWGSMHEVGKVSIGQLSSVPVPTVDSSDSKNPCPVRITFKR